MIVLVLILLILVLVLLRRVRIVHEVSTALLVRGELASQIVLLLVWVDWLWKRRRSGGIHSVVGGIIILLVLKWEIQSQAVVVWLHLEETRRSLKARGDQMLICGTGPGRSAAGMFLGVRTTFVSRPKSVAVTICFREKIVTA